MTYYVSNGTLNSSTLTPIQILHDQRCL